VASIVMAFRGMGPKITNGSADLSDFAYSWCNNASVLFLDNPAGVGFSYGARNGTDNKHTDLSARIDSMNFIMQFFADWPELKPNPLFIAGWSYGGVFAPNLAYAIHLHNQEQEMLGSINMTLNLKGMIIANGATKWEYTPLIPPVDMLLAYG
jgi:cathepsin A (carboxypeptidase C)